MKITKSKILVIEDEELTATAISTLLEKNNYQVMTAVTNLQDAQTALLVEVPDLILMDITIEGPLDGIAAARIISDKYDVPIVFLTASNDDKTLQKITEVAPFPVLIKPYYDKELLINIKSSIACACKKNKKRIKKDMLQLDSFLMAISKEIKQKRKVLKLTQEEASEKLKINHRHYQNIESGKINLKVETLIKLVNFYKIDLEAVSN